MIQTYEIYQCQSFAGLREKEGGKICLVFDHLAALDHAIRDEAAAKADQIANIEAALVEKDAGLLILKNTVISNEKQIAALGARNKELEDMWDAVQSISTCTVEYENDLVRAKKRIAALTAERDRLREEKDALRDHLTFLDSLKQTEPEKGYDDLTSTLDKQQEFERGCLERLSLLTKQTEGGGE